MERNVGSLDRIVRVIVGVLLLGLLLFLDSDLRWIGLIGLVPLLTGLLGTCPAYKVFGITTCRLGGSRLA